MGNSFARLKPAPPKAAPLLAPAVEGNVDTVKELIGGFIATYTRSADQKPGSDSKLQEFVDQVDGDGNGAIHGAVFGGHLELTRFLIESCGASVTLENNLGCSPLWLAAGYNKTDLLEYLLSLPELNNKDALFKTNKTGDTPLLAAASRGNVEACTMLLNHYEQLDGAVRSEYLKTRNNNGDTPFSVAVASDHGEGPLFDLLMDESIVEEKNKQGYNPLLIACERNWVNVLNKLLSRGASLDTRDKNGATPLCVAAFCGNEDVVKRILEVRKDLLNVPNTAGCTPLWLASRTGLTAMAVFLLEAGADATIASNDGLTPHQAATKYKKTSTEELFEEWSGMKTTKS
mmetsp:Transcript_28644/g.40208  ORF Transcript_28644/g.40208 Transcript_28644/m.40208 type:complete len:345 (-) Transcript_28644:73-1107(-)